MTAPRPLTTAALLLAVPLACVMAILVTAALGSGGDSGATPVANQILIEDFAYVPPKLSTAPDQQLRVRNLDGVAHTLTADDGAFDTGTLEGGQSTRIRVGEPGRYSYFCDIHEYMTGVITVKG